MHLSDPEAAVAASTPSSAFCCGAVSVSPDARELVGPEGCATLEPRVLQVLLVLAQRPGEVVGRGALLARCWPGMVVGDDSLNRAIASLRKALMATGGGLRVETIQKSGYRLRIDAPEAGAGAPPGPASSATPLRVAWRSRRRLLVGAGSAAVAFGGLTAWALRWRWTEPRAQALVEQAAWRMHEDRWGEVDPEALLKEAIRLEPGNARAWGLLALALRQRAEVSPNPLGVVAQCQTAARKALVHDPDQPDALLALATAEPTYTRWYVAERALVELQQRFPDHIGVLDELADLYRDTGRARDCLRLRDRMVQLQPASPRDAGNRVVALWLNGDAQGVDRALADAARIWPGHPALVELRIRMLAFAGHVDEALAELDRGEGARLAGPPMVPDILVATWRALAGRGTRDAAVRLAVAAAAQRQSSASQVMHLLASLGAIDEAFSVAEGYYLGRGAMKIPNRFSSAEPGVLELRYRCTGSLFFPTARALWPDPRFAALCGETGLMGYWRSSGCPPDLLGTRPFTI